MLERGDVAGARRAAAAQRHDLPLEPAGLRRRARPPAPARGEPRAAGGADGRRHARQRRLLLRAGARARRGRPAGVVADVLLGRRGELPRRRARRASTRACTGRRRRGRRRPSSSCAGCCRSPTRGSTAGAWTRPTATGCSGSSSGAASTQRNGASWQAAAFHRLYEERRLDRVDALREMTVRYREQMHSNGRSTTGRSSSSTPAPAAARGGCGVCTICTSVFSLMEPPGGMTMCAGCRPRARKPGRRHARSPCRGR